MGSNMKKFYLPVLFIVGVIILIFACEVDHGLYPIDYRIKGEIIFFGDEPPGNTDRIEVFAIKEFPPEDPQNFLYLGRSGSLDYSSGDTISYEVRVSPTNYQMIALLWKEKEQDWNLTGLLGFHIKGIKEIDDFANLTNITDINSLFPNIEVTKENPVVDSVNIFANWKVVSKDAHISGKITYQGKWPEDTNMLLLVIYKKRPNLENLASLLGIENIDYAQQLFTDSSTYRLAVNSSIYNYIGIYWVGKSISDISDLVEIGFYEDPDIPDVPGSVQISAGEEAKNYDIYVDFDNIEFP